MNSAMKQQNYEKPFYSLKTKIKQETSLSLNDVAGAQYSAIIHFLYFTTLL